MRFRNLTHHPFSFPIVILNPLLYPGPCTPTSPRNLLIHVALNPDFLALCGIVEHVIKKDSLGLDLVKLFEGLGGVIDGFVRLLRACQMRKGGSKNRLTAPAKAFISSCAAARSRGVPRRMSSCNFYKVSAVSSSPYYATYSTLCRPIFLFELLGRFQILLKLSDAFVGIQESYLLRWD